MTVYEQMRYSVLSVLYLFSPYINVHRRLLRLEYLEIFFFFLKKRTHFIEYSKTKQTGNLHVRGVWCYE
jgi:hypothetical protein